MAGLKGAFQWVGDFKYAALEKLTPFWCEEGEPRVLAVHLPFVGP